MVSFEGVALITDRTAAATANIIFCCFAAGPCSSVAATSAGTPTLCCCFLLRLQPEEHHGTACPERPFVWEATTAAASSPASSHARRSWIATGNRHTRKKRKQAVPRDSWQYEYNRETWLRKVLYKSSTSGDLRITAAQQKRDATARWQQPAEEEELPGAKIQYR